MINALSLITSLCLNQPASCQTEMSKCYKKIVRELKACEKSLPNGPTRKAIESGNTCVDTFLDWKYTSTQDKVDYCAVYIIDAPLPKPYIVPLDVERE